MFVRALAIREAVYGADNPYTALVVHNLGVLRLEQDRLDDAAPLLERALTIRQETLGPAHVRIAESLEACARLYRRLGREAEADTLEEQAKGVRAELD
jgi:hypothetical protein